MKRITKKMLEAAKHSIDKKKKALQAAEQRHRKLDGAYFLQQVKKPEYDYRKFKAPPLKIERAHQTTSKWWDTGTVSVAARSSVFLWVCIYCGVEVRRKYIATGHDHTDYSYEVCDCDGCQHMTPYDQLT